MTVTYCKITAEQRDWSGLPPELLGSISSRLSFFDMLSFRGVCSSWLVAAKATPNWKKFPLLLLFADTRPKFMKRSQIHKSFAPSTLWDVRPCRYPLGETQNCSNSVICRSSQINNRSSKEETTLIEMCRHRERISRQGSSSDRRFTQIFDSKAVFFSIKEERSYSMETQYFNNLGKMVGSHPDGWIVLIDEDNSPYLLRILAKAQRIHFRKIQLPKSLLLPDGTLTRLKCTIRRSVMSVVSNSSRHRGDDLIVISIDHLRTAILIWRNGDKGWSVLEGECYYDIALCNNTLYALKILGRFDFVSVEAWDFSTTSSGSCSPEMKFSIEVSCMSGCMSNSEDCYYHTTRLVGSPTTGEIFVLAYGGKCKDDPNPNWVIFKVDSNERRCVQVNSLNGEALLLGNTSSIFVSSKDVEDYGYKPNSIYFVGNWWKGTTEIKLNNFSLEDARVQHIWDSGKSTTVGFAWIAPSNKSGS
ncbi:hypothetical protein OROMI_006702 [Orobanche minor]